MPRKPAPKGPRSDPAKHSRTNRARNDKSVPIQNLPIQSQYRDSAEAVRGGGRKQAADPAPKESISISFTKPQLEY
jgi:hypothetical protein